MSKRDQSPETKRHRRPGAPHGKKKSYRAPQIVIYGDVATLTAGGGSILFDHGANMMLVA